MKLYAVTLSPFASRVRLALRLKGLACAMVQPPGGTRSPEYLAINPIGKLPVLVTDEGVVVPESEVIVDYLDDRYPLPPLMPDTPEDRARMRMVIRTFELYVTPALTRLFGQMSPATRDAGIVAAELARLHDGLALVAHFVDDDGFAVGDRPGKADCMLLPGLLLVKVAGDIFAIGDPVEAQPRLAAYRDRARRHPDMAAEWDETATALAAFRGG